MVGVGGSNPLAPTTSKVPSTQFKTPETKVRRLVLLRKGMRTSYLVLDQFKSCDLASSRGTVRLI